jgi:hypothetical protein
MASLSNTPKKVSVKQLSTNFLIIQSFLNVMLCQLASQLPTLENTAIFMAKQSQNCSHAENYGTAVQARIMGCQPFGVGVMVIFKGQTPHASGRKDKQQCRQPVEMTFQKA